MVSIMNENIRLYYIYFIENKDKKILKDVKSYCKKNKIDFSILTDKVTRNIAKLKFELNGLGYELSLEGFSKLLEDYLSKKSTLNDSIKRRYLKILVNLSKIYNIDLRSELLKTSKEKSIDQVVIRQFIEFHLSPNITEEKIDKLKDILLKKDISYDTLSKKYMPFIDDIKKEATSLNFNTDKESFIKLIDEYNNKKTTLTHEEKVKYLQLIFKLSKIYDIDIKDKLSTKKCNAPLKLDIKNPLDNTLYFKELLKERFTSGSFDLINTHSKDYKEPLNQEYNSAENRLKLIESILHIYLDKITNYAKEDIIDEYAKLLEDKDITFLNNLSSNDLFEYLNALLNNKKEPAISPNIITLLRKLIEITDYSDNIGTENKNIFKCHNSKSIYAIYLNTSSSNNTFKIINEYIKECINNNLNYDMRPFDEVDKTIIYSSKEDLNNKINILNNILSNSELKEMGTPLEYTAKINNTNYSISNISINNLNFQEFFISLLETSYYRVLSKIIINKVDNPQDSTIIDSFIKLTNITFDGDRVPFNILCNKNSFNTIKDTVHKYIPEVINTLEKYFTEEKQLDKITIEFKKSIKYIFNIVNDYAKTNSENISVIIEKI